VVLVALLATVSASSASAAPHPGIVATIAGALVFSAFHYIGPFGGKP